VGLPIACGSEKYKFWTTGAKVPGIESSRERKFHVIFALGSESSRERKFQGAKVPPMELSLSGAKVRGNESSSYRPSVIMQDQNVVAAVRTWSQHAAGDGRARWVRTRQSRGRGGDAWRVRLELHQQNGVSLKEGHENLRTSPSTLNWWPCMQQRLDQKSGEQNSRPKSL